MRTLATVAFSFAAAVLTAALLPQRGWYLPAAGVLVLLFAAFLLLRKRWRQGKRAALMAASAAAALVWFFGYQQLVQQPVLDRCGSELPFTGVACSYPTESDYGARVTLRIDGSPFRKAVLYGDETLLTLQPGNTVSGIAQWNDAAQIRETRLTTFTSRGILRCCTNAESCLRSRGRRTVSAGGPSG